MKNLNLAEKIGIVLGITGAIMIILNVYFEDNSFKEILALNQIVFWFGILVWAFGKMQAAATERKKQENENTNLE